MNQTTSERQSTTPNNPSENNTKVGAPLNSLSPINDADEDGHYSQMLLWALENREQKDIKNIALTGPYGSGKSSILKTFEKKHNSSKLVFLNISLATFKEEKDGPSIHIKQRKPEDDTKKENDSKEDSKESPLNSAIEKQAQLRLVELSILQQIFYHEKDEDIPDTRFKKTRSFSEESANMLAWSIFLFAISFLYIIYSKEIWTLLGISPNKCQDITFNVVALIVLIVLGFTFIKKSIRPLRSIQIRKFNFQDAEFAIDENISKSILNEHLDELLYFFEVTPYTVVVFEDLDRFEQTEIFTKLRELNHLINYSKKMNNKRVTFVYAVRDDMFKDKDRTKFFDFIIPVIPVINSSNSNDILLNIVSENGYKIKHDLLDDISLFVDDMRLLYNIMNEYYLYHKKIEIKDHNKMLSLIVYKNIYPNDFVALSNGTGELSDVISNKAEYIKQGIIKYEKKIDEYRAEIKTLEKVSLNDTKDLRKLYVLEYIAKNPKIAGFVHADTHYSISQASEENIFTFFIENSMLYTQDEYQSGGYKLQTSFKAIENSIDSENPYEMRLKLLEDKSSNKINDLKQYIKTVEEQKTKLKNASLQQLLTEDIIAFELKDAKQLQLISILMRSGYIDENYMDYISFFYEGSINREDKEFLLNVKAHIKTEFDHKLIKIDKLINKIPIPEFEQEYVLNYYLVDYLLSAKSKYKYQRAGIFETLSNETPNSITFIDAYVDKCKQLPVFIKELTGNWSNIWSYIIEKSDLTSERAYQYFKLIIEHSDLHDLKRISNQSNFKTLVESDANFLSIIKDEQRIRKIVLELDIKLNVLNVDGSPLHLIDFIFKGNHYKIDETMITTWMNFKGDYFEKEFMERNYTLINRQNKELEPLIQYIDKNITTYIEEMWLAIDSKKREDAEFLERILNHKELSLELKEKVVSRNETTIQSLEKLKDIGVIRVVMDLNKLTPSWTNLFFYFKLTELTFDSYLLSFINNIDNASKLSHSRMVYKEEDGNDKREIEEFAEAFVLNTEINDTVYDKLIVCMPFRYIEGLAFENLNESKLRSLLKILMVTKQNYDKLRKHQPYLHIELLAKDETLVISKLDDFEMDDDDIAKILSSLNFSVASKNTILHQLEDSEIIENSELLKNLGQITAIDDNITISKEIATAIFDSELSVQNKVKLYLKKASLYNRTEFYQLIAHFGESFNLIKPNGKHVLIPHTLENMEFANSIFRRGYTYEPKKEKKGIRIRNLRKERT